ncbi:MAG: flagellar biosynthesis protein FliA [Thioclava sp.]|uniref:flagellar biosynthesis protein FliA n=1 Tax=Thioclava electrotropha TaxID=1549850 RepID=UPI000C4F9C19|nr:flagellar biosynthesis protein FliA [Thioclava electrotropha]MAQ36683.1 flagellar biosynthesis protein FliA [Thioclava sp.]
MKVAQAFRNLDRHGQQRAPEVIQEEVRQLAPHLARFCEDLVRLDVSASQTKGKTRIHVSLRLQLPSGVIAAHEDGFEIEPVLRKAFADLRHRVDRHVGRLKHEHEVKRPARRRRIGAPLPPVRDAAEAERRALFFDLIEDHLDAVYDTVRRELTYLECSGEVPEGYLSVRSLVDATILKGLARFEDRPSEFSVGDWLKRLAFETIGEEARAARRAVPQDAASLDAAPEAPAEEPTEADQEMFEFYQPDDMLLLEELVADETGEDPEAAAASQESAQALHRAIAALPALWRRVVALVDLDDTPAERAAAILGIPEDEVTRTVAAAHSYLREKLGDAGHSSDRAGATLAAVRKMTARLPLPLVDRSRIETALSVEREGETS